MLEAIALKLITTLTGYLMQGYLDSLSYNKIDGAPTWYGDSSKNKLVGYGYYPGGIETIEVAKDKCRLDVKTKLDKSIEVVIYDNFKHIKKAKEKELINRFKNDENQGVFLTKTIRFEKVEHQSAQDKSLFQDARIERTFTACSIPVATIIEYQKERLVTIQKELLTFKSNSALEELDEALKEEK